MYSTLGLIYNPCIRKDAKHGIVQFRKIGFSHTDAGSRKALSMLMATIALDAWGRLAKRPKEPAFLRVCLLRRFRRGYLNVCGFSHS